LSPLAAARAEDNAADFFRGKRLTYIVPTKPGGGYDAYARLIARHLPKYLPVKAVQVRNVPGAGHLIGLRQIQEAPPDGLTLGTFNTGLIYNQFRGEDGMRVDLRNLSWIGKASDDPRVLVVGPRSRARTVGDLIAARRPLLFAGAGKGTASDIDTALIAQSLGLTVKRIQGFGGADAELALLRGDIDGMIGSYSSLRDFVEQGHGRILLKVGEAPQELSAIPELAALTKDARGGAHRHADRGAKLARTPHRGALAPAGRAPGLAARRLPAHAGGPGIAARGSHATTAHRTNGGRKGRPSTSNDFSPPQISRRCLQQPWPMSIPERSR
jgi:tripartite-type tricarboxylate transporter receptor subunit TctC